MIKKISEIKLDKNQPRKTFDENKLKEMSETFKTQGTIQPIEIDENNIIITGELRWRSAKIAGLKEIPVRVIKGLSKEGRLERQLVENFNRQDMRLVDSIDAIKRYIKHLYGTQQMYNSNDKMISEVASHLGLNRSWLSQNLKFEKEAPIELKKAVKEKKMTISQATEIMKLPEQEDREEITKEILKESEVPEYRKIREKVKDIKARKELDKRAEEIKKSKEGEIKIKRTEEVLSDLRDNIDREFKRINKLMFLVGKVRRTKLYLHKPKEKEDFFRYLDGIIDGVERWSKELRNLKDNLELEIIST